MVCTALAKVIDRHSGAFTISVIQFFLNPRSYVASHDSTGLVGTISSADAEDRLRMLTGQAFAEEISKSILRKAFTLSTTDISAIDDAAYIVFDAICEHALGPQHTTKNVSHLNEICLSRHQYRASASNAINMVISHWMRGLCIQTADVITIIIAFSGVPSDAEMRRFNFGMLEFIQQTDNRKRGRETTRDKGFATIHFGSNKKGLQLFDRQSKTYVTCDTDAVFAWIGEHGRDIADGQVPAAQYRVANESDK